jgi:hypothetical protein
VISIKQSSAVFCCLSIFKINNLLNQTNGGF